MLGTHQGAISREYLDYYLDEFVFRFNRRSSRSPGRLLYRLVQRAVAVEPARYHSIVAGLGDRGAVNPGHHILGSPE